MTLKIGSLSMLPKMVTDGYQRTHLTSITVLGYQKW